jgi:hypothetical protein
MISIYEKSLGFHKIKYLACITYPTKFIPVSDLGNI